MRVYKAALAVRRRCDYDVEVTSPRAIRWKLLAGLWLWAACSHRPAQSRDVSSTPASAAPLPVAGHPQRPVPVSQPTVFTPAVPSAKAYGGPPLPALNTDPLARQIRRELTERARKAGFAPPASDGRLDQAATELAAWQGPLGHDLVNFVCHHVGLAEPQPGVTSLRSNHGDPDLVEHVVQHTQEALTHSAWARLGVGVSRAQGEVGVVVLLGSAAVQLQPVPRTLKAADTAQVQGRIPVGFTQPQVVVTTPGGRTGRLPLAAKGLGFSSSFRCLEGPGRYDVEVLASGPRGPEVMVNVPVYCDEAPPSRFELRPDTVFGDASSPEAVEQAMLAAINRERQKRGIAAVKSDPRLAELARAHSRDMAEQRAISHLSSRGQDAQVRVQAAGLSPRLVAENVGTATTASAVHEGFMGSPGHRSNVLDPRATHVGVGAVEGLAPNGLMVWYVSELYAGFASAK